MGININNFPLLLSPAGNPLTFTFESSETGQDNFSYVVELFINGSLRLTAKVFRQSDVFSRINVQEAVQASLSTYDLFDDLYFDATAFLVPYSIIVYESYGSPPTLHDSANSGLRIAYNGAFEFNEAGEYNYFDYTIDVTSPFKFLTDAPHDKRFFIGMHEYYFLAYFAEVALPNTYVIVELYNVTNGLVSAEGLILTTTGGFNALNVGPQQIINASQGPITQGAFDSTFYYTIKVTDGGISQESEVVTIYIDQSCTDYDDIRLYFLNKFGAYDQFSFNLVSTNTATIKSFDYEQDPGQWNATGAYIYPNGRGQMVNYAKTKVKQLVVNSDFMNQDVQNWLVTTLFDSPLVYMQINGSSEYEVVKVTNSTARNKRRRTDGLIQETVTIDRTFTYTSQII
jgi:hypothetical protein